MTFQRLTEEEAREVIERLVETYKRQAAQVEAPNSPYTELEARSDFIDPLLVALGWDVNNSAGVSQVERDVVRERTGDNEGNNSIGRPDYRLRIAGRDRVPLEAKKPSVRLNSSPSSSLQARSYGWSLSLPAAVLTNFAELAIFDATVTPEEGDDVDVALIPGLRFTCDEYVSRFDELWERLSYESIGGDDFYRVYSFQEPPRGTSPFDVTFLETFRTWRLLLAQDIATNNPALGAREIGRRTQRVLNALLFLRVCEDRHIGQYEGLLRSAEASTVVEAFRDADRAFNAGLFTVLQSTNVSDQALSRVIKQLYWPRTKFAFGVLSPDILAEVYEQYLAERVELDATRRVSLVEKPELTHAGGIVPTPDFIVQSILDGTLGSLLPAGQAPGADLTILDPACGSGVFLVAALERLRLAAVDAGAVDDLHLRARLVQDHIFGVDIDGEAVEVAKLSLLLAVLGDDLVDVRLARNLLPDLTNNILAGNTLIQPNFDSVQPTAAAIPERRAAVSPLDLAATLAPLQSGGFKVILGNPPYIRIQTLAQHLPDQLAYFQDPRSSFASSQAFNFDTYMLFIERSLGLLRPDGALGLIVPHRFTNSLAGGPVRAVLGPRLTRLVHFRETQIFPDRATYTCLIFASGPQAGDAELLLAGNLDEFLAGATKVDALERAILTADPWPIASDAQKAVFAQMEASAVARLGDADWVKIFVGVQTSRDSVFFIKPDAARSTADLIRFKDERGRSWEIERAVTRPAVQDATVRAFDRDPEPDTVAIFPYEVTPPPPGRKRGQARVFTPEEMAALYPKATAYLASHETALRARAMDISEDAYWAYGRSQSLTQLDDPKIIVQVLSLTPRYAIDTRGLLVPGGGDGGPYYLLRPEANCPYPSEVLVAVLSHPVVDAFVAASGRAYRGSYVVHRKRFLEAIPMPALSSAEVSRLTDLITEMNGVVQRLRTETDTATRTTLEGRLDVLRQESEDMITSAFGLTQEQVAAVVG